MPVVALEIAPYVHREMTPVAFGTGAIIFAAALLAVAVATTQRSPEWRRAWLLAASLCLLLAVDEAFPLDKWVSSATGLRWWLIYAIPVVIGIRGWSRAMRLLRQRLPRHVSLVQLLRFGTLCWIGAYGLRLVAYSNDHILGPRIITRTMYVLEALLKLGAAALCVVALAEVFVRVRGRTSVADSDADPAIQQI